MSKYDCHSVASVVVCVGVVAVVVVVLGLQPWSP